MPAPRGVALIQNGHRFAEFFQRGGDASPLIPMLALNSGLGGNWMSLLDLSSEEDGEARLKANAAQQVLTSHNDFSRLKVFAAEHLRTSGFRVRPMREGDPVLQGYPNHTLGHSQARCHSALGSIGAAMRS